jgi:hypothetical protein
VDASGYERVDERQINPGVLKRALEDEYEAEENGQSGSVGMRKMW